jgi:hypothetical protein
MTMFASWDAGTITGVNESWPSGSGEKINLVRFFAHRRNVHEIVVLLSLGLLVFWTLGPFAVLIVYHVPPLRRFLGLDDSCK